jgi:S1-C subfamily serine protease
MLTVTHIHQGTQADEMEWPVGELIVKANEKEIHSLNELREILNNNKNNNVLLECRNGRIGYFYMNG